MPKSANSEMKIVQGPSRPQPPSRKIMHQTPPEPGPHHNPPSASPGTASNQVASATVRAAENPGSIDPTQQRY
jgi:hypothetical protein